MSRQWQMYGDLVPSASNSRYEQMIHPYLFITRVQMCPYFFFLTFPAGNFNGSLSPSTGGNLPNGPCNHAMTWHNFKVMIERAIKPIIKDLLTRFPAVGLLGPRQVGKTTLALSLASELKDTSIYLDLELHYTQ